MKTFLDSDFLLQNKTSRELYHGYAKEQPIIDYHCHLPPDLIAANHQFENLTQIWLNGDHYKWRAMRTSGINENYITGNKSDYKKFEAWAKTVPFTLRNPLYHWSHLELQRYFGIHDLLDEKSAPKIYEECSAKLKTPDFSVRNLLRKMNVALICTTDDPVDSLEHHIKLKKDKFEIPVLPAFRPDRALQVEVAKSFNMYVTKIEEASNKSISTFKDYLDALKSRHDFFHQNGCSVSDHGLEEIYAADFTDKEIENIFGKLRFGLEISLEDRRKFKSAMLLHLAEWDWEKKWTQQYHLGALRNTNLRMMRTLGPDTGWDSIGDFQQARPLVKFLGQLDNTNKLAKTILYNLNPADNEVMATMIGNFNDGTIAGKIQWGSSWWFLDQKDGMTKQLNALSNMGLLSKFVGMLTDSRSFMSFPRHEYFRRILCNLLGEEIENGELPQDLEWTGKIISDICFYNAQSYFGWEEITKNRRAVS